MMRHGGLGLRIMVWLWVCFVGAQGEACAQSTELQRVLAKLGAAAVALEHSLPSFSCEESVVSQELRGDKVKDSVDFTATMRAVRETNGRLGESFQIMTVKGKPFREGHFHTPAYLNGGFDAAMRYFAPDQQFCYAYALKGQTVEFATSAQGMRDGCKDEGMTGVATLDAEGNVVRIERTVPVEVARATHLAQYVAIDFADVAMNGRTYRLSQHVVAEMTQGRSVGRFEATYSGCKLFQATATIGPAEIVPEDAAAPK